MALTKRSDTKAVYLEVKHYSLWRQLKKHEPGCEEVSVTNPRTGMTSIKFGYGFDTLTGRATKLEKYDTGDKYATRYFGFQLHVVDGADTFVLKMPYHSQVLRRFLRLARNIDWNLPFSLTVFKGKKKSGSNNSEETGIWFQQRGETVKSYYTKEQPHGMPAAIHDPTENSWDFKPQHRWLVERLQSETMVDIETAAAKAAPPIEPHVTSIDEFEEPSHDDQQIDYNPDHISDDDLPF